jgi:hypothetical protein
MSLLTRDAILCAEDRKVEEVEVPEWGGSVKVATMTGAQRDLWEQSLVGKTGVNIANIRARLVAACVVDDSGARLFTDEDAIALGAKSALALDRVAKVAQRLNGLGKEEVEAARGN